MPKAVVDAIFIITKAVVRNYAYKVTNSENSVVCANDILRVAYEYCAANTAVKATKDTI